ncbi:MAG: SUMF1/EgtB/PvdO family nonheme iron enzyme [Armatimonadota bacterium]|nr:MAG: SUMF1/EgtB/PvdO family nonheme iron enzyme [Armatimonadota bacterium]
MEPGTVLVTLGVAVAAAVIARWAERIAEATGNASAAVYRYAARRLKLRRVFLKRYEKQLREKCGTSAIGWKDARLDAGLDVQTQYVSLDLFIDTLPLGPARTEDLDEDEPLARMDAHSRYAILGEAGSGKTTLLKHLVLQVLDGTPPSDALRGSIPVLVELGGKAYGRPEEWITAEFSGFPDAGRFVAENLANGRLLVLLDGLDEIADEKLRGDISERITLFAEKNESCPVVVASRYEGFMPARFGPVFSTVRVAPLSPPQQRLLCEAVISDRTLSEDVLQLVRWNPGLARLTENPLGLAMLCFIHLRRGSARRPPDARPNLFGLYDDYLTLIMEYREAARGLQSDATLIARYNFLSDLAFAVWRDGASEFSADEAFAKTSHERCLQCQIRNVRQLERLLRYLCERNAVLMPGRQTGSYRFSHRTYQEFFVARSLYQQGPTGKAIVDEILPDANARSVVLFYAGTPSDAPDLVERLMERGDLVRALEVLAHSHTVDDAVADASVSSAMERVGLDWRRSLDLLRLLPYVATGKRMVSVVDFLCAMAEQESEPVASQQLSELVALVPLVGVENADGLHEGMFYVPGCTWHQAAAGEAIRIEGFWIGGRPVTEQGYERFLRDQPGVVLEPKTSLDLLSTRPEARSPVRGLCWSDANAYASWRDARLPTKAEAEVSRWISTKGRGILSDIVADVRTGQHDGRDRQVVRLVRHRVDPRHTGGAPFHSGEAQGEDETRGTHEGNTIPVRVTQDGRQWAQDILECRFGSYLLLDSLVSLAESLSFGSQDEWTSSRCHDETDADLRALDEGQPEQASRSVQVSRPQYEHLLSDLTARLSAASRVPDEARARKAPDTLIGIYEARARWTEKRLAEVRRCIGDDASEHQHRPVLVSAPGTFRIAHSDVQPVPGATFRIARSVP